MNNLQFFQDLLAGGGHIQVCTKYKGLCCSNEAEVVVRCIQNNQAHDLYFVTGVNPECKLQRVNDSDVKMKKSFYVDVDVRKHYPDITDEELRTTYLQQTVDTLAAHEEARNWRWIVCSGNGFQIHYVGKNTVPLFHGDVQKWTAGVQKLYSTIEELTGIQTDEVCANPSRLTRCPGSLNHKSNPPKTADVVMFQDCYFPEFDNILPEGQKILEKKHDVQAKKNEEIQNRQATTGQTAYDKINLVPIADVVCKLLQWTTVVDGDKTYFLSPSAQRRSACYVRAGENTLYHGGTYEFESFGLRGFSPFTFVKHVGNKTNAQTFFWFRDMYGIGSDTPVQENKSQSITDVFDKLRKADFNQLKLGCILDKYDLFMRKLVVRIGALSYTGKSKVGYWLVHLLCKNGYGGFIFSTEVTSERVLAELLHQVHPHSKHPKDILRGQVVVDEEHIKPFQNLEIYDSTTTNNNLSEIEKIIAKGCQSPNPPAFALIDFVQGVRSKKNASDEYASASNYATEIQMIAQKYNICIIDLSQLNADGMRDTYKDQGFIPFMNSRALYSNADVAIMLKRDRSIPGNNQTTFSIRKHKYGDPLDLILEYEHSTGMFSVMDSVFHAFD
jgi:DnaB-like helicase C terminal domain